MKENCGAMELRGRRKKKKLGVGGGNGENRTAGG